MQNIKNETKYHRNTLLSYSRRFKKLNLHYTNDHNFFYHFSMFMHDYFKRYDSSDNVYWQHEHLKHVKFMNSYFNPISLLGTSSFSCALSLEIKSPCLQVNSTVTISSQLLHQEPYYFIKYFLDCFNTNHFDSLVVNIFKHIHSRTQP